ncbi:MAG: DNA-binding protein [Oscillospiraceae bacterium]|nr:DNA-binding protein [Oscillospiraceae bacterium]
MKNQAYRMAMLFDFYGDLLTDRQREFYDLYYNEDLSLAEIAENYGISRQGVRDVIVRAEAAMTEIEDKTHIIRRFQQSRGAIAAIDAAADQLLQAVNRRSYSDAMLDELAHTIKTNVAKLEQE